MKLSLATFVSLFCRHIRGVPWEKIAQWLDESLPKARETSSKWESCCHPEIWIDSSANPWRGKLSFCFTSLKIHFWSIYTLYKLFNSKLNLAKFKFFIFAWGIFETRKIMQLNKVFGNRMKKIKCSKQTCG